MKTSKRHPLTLSIAFSLALATFSVGTNAATEVALWNFDNNYLTSVGNSSYNLTPSGNVGFVSSPWDAAAGFSGGSLVTSATPMDSAFSGGLSIMGWVKMDNGGGGPLLSHIDGNAGFDLTFTRNGPALVVASSNGSFVRGSNVSPSTSIVPDQWYHIAVTWDGNFLNKNPLDFNFYVNGQLVDTSWNSISSTPNFEGLNGTTPAPITVGGASSSLFLGDIDHLSLYYGVILPTDVQADYLGNASTDVPEPSCVLSLAICMFGVAFRRIRKRRKV